MDLTGQWAVGFLMISLAITPLRRLAAWPSALILRRMLGLTALAYSLAHVVLYFVYENSNLSVVVSEVALRAYLTVGFIAVLGLALLGATSTDGWTRRLGRTWKRLHRLIYGLSALALLHYFMSMPNKIDVSLPTLFTGLFLWLMLWRSTPERWQLNSLLLIGLAVASMVGDALIEYG